MPVHVYDDDTLRLSVEGSSPDTGAAPSKPKAATGPYTCKELREMHKVVSHPGEYMSQVHFFPKVIREEDHTISTELELNNAVRPEYDLSDKLTLDSNRMTLGGDFLAHVLAHLSATWTADDASEVPLFTQVWSGFIHVLRQKSKWPPDLRLIENAPLSEDEDQSASAADQSVIKHRPSMQVGTDRCKVQCRSGVLLSINFEPSLPQAEVDTFKERFRMGPEESDGSESGTWSVTSWLRSKVTMFTS